MSDPVLTLILIPSFFAALTVVYWFKTLDGGLWRQARIPLVAGILAGSALRLAAAIPGSRFFVTGILLTLAALYVRLTGRESEASEGMVLGSISGAAAAVPFLVMGDPAVQRFAECTLSGAVAGYGITFGLTHVRVRSRQLALDFVTLALAICAAAVPALLLRTGLELQAVAIGAAALVPLLVVCAAFAVWPVVRAGLAAEARLGFVDEADVRTTAHPFLRLGRAGWYSAGAHREFVRIATQIALRQRRQRERSEEVARLYQLEVIKLRMDLQEMARIDRTMRLQSLQQQTAGGDPGN
jgi:hypothetical protein